MSDEINFSKKGKRSVSSFVGQELLYDYILDILDPERKKAIDSLLSTNKEVVQDLQKIRQGIEYANVLAQTQVSGIIVEKIKRPSSYLQVLLQKIKFDRWPPLVKMGIEASVVACGIVIVAVAVPWGRLIDIKLSSDKVLLTQLEKDLSKKPISEIEISKTEISFPDEGSSSETVVAEQNAPVTTTTTIKAVVAKSAPVVPSTTIPLPKKTESAAATTELAADSGPTDGKKAGVLFRGIIAVTNAKAAGAKIVDKITTLGARKAGNVELGWSKGSGAYFHFTMPEGKYEEMLSVFKEYGQLKIQKEHHERVMPEGIVRIIITVDEKK